jgi:hypothetical protein
MSALERIPDASQTSRHVRKVPNADMVNGILTKKNRRKAASQFRLMFVGHAAINAGLRLSAIKDCKAGRESSRVHRRVNAVCPNSVADFDVSSAPGMRATIPGGSVL